MTVVELRRYTLHPGRRDELIELFERELVAPQEDVGMTVAGQFRDLDRPDQFVWLRAFADMDARDRGLRAFYLGPVWAAHRDAANATMIDSDDVFLLRADSWSVPRSRPDVDGDGDGFVVIVVAPESSEPPVAGTELATLVSEAAENTFPQLPVRTGSRVAVQVRAFASLDAADTYRDQVRQRMPDAHVARLRPTGRSRLQGG